MSVDKTESLLLFNPFTNQKIHIPDAWVPSHNIMALTCTSSPTSSDCSVFLICCFQGLMVFGCAQNGSGVWVWRFCISGKLINFPISNCAILSHNDEYLYYCLDVKGRVAIFHTGRFKWYFKKSRRVGWADVPSKLVNRSYLAAGDDGKEAYAVIVSHNATQVRVYKLNPSEATWIRVENLRDKMLFVSGTTSFVARATEKRMGNKIYFPKFHGKNGVFYSLTTKKYHSYDGQFPTEDPSGLIDVASSSTWIQQSLY
ncbi:OLC1v1002332C1 [Oldenlandia corymbosa var. corymbosa]|uniref:OLC1v1002332C1 n=1 Tax=Oldenlandia corymbosa var. corymbosa TaxID=529605 RepID=A0AAV1D7E4_OLDCO|nr:OLC1v1002332C1 [Oldenlandia corymbosa var. corymbosa]